MQTTSITIRNFINILRSGAFDDVKPIGMLSNYKWRKLVDLAKMHGLIQVFANGLERYHYDNNLNISESLIDEIGAELRVAPITGFADLYDFNHMVLQSKPLNQQLKDIIRKEFADTERSYETLQAMAIILFNAEHILTGRSYLKGIIDLGRYLRLEGNKVDFVKLEEWLKKTEMTGMGNLQGSLLITGFGFTIEELPFVVKLVKKPMQQLLSAISHDDLSQLRPWALHESKGGFVVGSPLKIYRSVRHSLRFQHFAPRETYATIFRGLARGISEIEE